MGHFTFALAAEQAGEAHKTEQSPIVEPAIVIGRGAPIHAILRDGGQGSPGQEQPGHDHACPENFFVISQNAHTFQSAFPVRNAGWNHAGTMIAGLTRIRVEDMYHIGREMNVPRITNIVAVSELRLRLKAQENASR